MASLNDLFDRYRARADVAALAEVFDRTAPQLLRVARAICPRSTGAEDLLQATFLKAIESASTFDANRQLMPWLMGILVNEARSQRRRVPVPLAQVPDEPVDDETPLRAVSRRELDAELDTALLRLPATYREVLRPLLCDGSGGAEIARRLGRSPGTVRMQIHRGLAMLSRLLPRGIATAWLLVLAPQLLALGRVRAATMVRAGSKGRTLMPAGGVLLKKTITSCVSAVLLVAAAVFFWNTMGSTSRMPGASRIAAVPPATASVEPDRSAPTDASDVHRELAVRSDPLPANGSNAERAIAPEILVIDAATGGRLAGASVALLELARLPDRELLAFEAGGVELEPLLQAFGERAESNERGEVALHTGRASALLLSGTHGDLSGMLVVRYHQPRPLELELAAHDRVRVGIVDQGGMPVADVPVGLRIERGGRARTIFVARTKRDGVAELRHIGGALQLGSVGDVVVGPELLMASDMQQRVDRNAPKDIYQFTMPPFGAIEFRLATAGGQPARGTYSVRVRAIGEAPAPARQIVVPMIDGRCQMPMVGLGLRLAVDVQSSAYAKTSSEHAGPQRPGERLVIELPARDLPVVRGRILIDGSPLAAQRIGIVFKDPAAEDTQRRSTLTDRDGTFHFELPRGYLGGDRRLEVRRGEHGRVVDLSYELGVGIADLGDLILHRMPILVAGTVVDSREQPVAGAMVRLHRLRERSADLSWDGIRELDVVTDPGGRFVIRGRIEARGLAIQVTHPDFARGEITPIARSAKDVVHRLHAAGSVVGRILVGTEVERGVVRLSLLDNREREASMEIDCDVDGSFHGRRLTAGNYRLVGRTNAGDEFEIQPRIEVAADGSAELGDLDLRSRLHCVSVQITDAEGSPVSGARLGVLDGRGKGTWRSLIADRRGRVQVAFLRDHVPATATAAGRQPVDVRLHAGTRRIEITLPDG